MIETLEQLIVSLGLEFRISNDVDVVKSYRGVILVNPGKGDVLLLMTVVGKCLTQTSHQNPAVRIALYSYNGWLMLLKRKDEVSERLYNMLIDNAVLRTSLDTLPNQLMVLGMMTALKNYGESYMFPQRIYSRFPAPSISESESVESALESSIPSLPPDILESLNRFINRL